MQFDGWNKEMLSLEEVIRTAFAGNQYPGDEHLTVFDCEGREYDETYKLLQGKTWEKLPVAQFMSGDTPIPDLTPEAFHYYAPALLIASISGFPDLANAVTFYFTPASCDLLPDLNDQKECLARFNERFALFSTEQRKVIAEVLREYTRRGWEEEANVREAINFLDTDALSNS